MKDFDVVDELTTSLGYSPGGGARLLLMLVPPPGLEGLVPALSRFALLMNQFPAVFEGIAGKPKGDEVRQFLARLLPAVRSRQSVLPARWFDFPKDKTGTNSFRDLCLESAPLWSLTVNGAAIEALRPAWDRLFAELSAFTLRFTDCLLTHVEELAQAREWPNAAKPLGNCQSAFSNAARALRILSRQEYADLVAALESGLLPGGLPGRCADQAAWDTGDVPRKTMRYVQSLGAFLEITLLQREPRKRGSGNNSGKGEDQDGYILEGGSLRAPPEVVEDGTLERIFRRRRDASEEVDDSHADEQADDPHVEIFTPTRRERQRGARKPVPVLTRILQAQHARSLQARHNQDLPFDSRGVSDEQLTTLIKLLWQKDVKWPLEQQALRCSLVLGRDLPDIASIRISLSTRSWLGGIEYLADSREWRFQVHGPSYKTEFSPQEAAVCRSLVEAFRLPSFADIEINEEQMAAAKTKRVRLFEKDWKKLESDARELLREVPAYARLSTTQISRILYQKISSGCDAGVAALLFGARGLNSVTVRSYTTPSVAFLSQTYLDAVRPFVPESVSVPKIWQGGPQHGTGKHAGARWCPLDETIRDWVWAVQARLKVLTKDFPKRKSVWNQPDRARGAPRQDSCVPDPALWRTGDARAASGNPCVKGSGSFDRVVGPHGPAGQGRQGHQA